jgi:putative transposase
MARPPSINVAGGTYHVMNRGNRKAAIFEDATDCKRFLRLVLDAREEFGVEILGGCLMVNHFHLLVLTPNPNLSEFMQRLQGQFAEYSNWRHKRVGHVFGGRFRRVLVESDLHFLTAASYVFMNPVVAGLATRLEEWKWSTYAATAGIAPAPSYLSLDWLDNLFPTGSREESQRKLREIMCEERPVESYIREFEMSSDEARNQPVRSFIGERLHQLGVPRFYRCIDRPTIDELIPDGANYTDRALAIQRAHVVYGYTLAEIARSLGIHPTTAGRMLRSLRKPS